MWANDTKVSLLHWNRDFECSQNDFVQIQTTGNAVDFGDLTTPKSGASACSDSHGGLG